MAKLGKYTQDPSEKKRYTIDYSDWLDSDEELATVTYEVDPAGELVIDDDEIVAGNESCLFFASAGYDGETYTVLVTATTTIGQIKEDVILFVIKDNL